MKVFPIPVNTPFVDTVNKSLFSYSWTQYFKSIGDYAVKANMIMNGEDNNFKYTLNGAVCFCTYYNTTPLASPIDLKLPYTSQCAFEVNGDVYPPFTIKINIPAGTAFLQFNYMVQLQ